MLLWNFVFSFPDATQYAHYVFNTIKQNASGQISFEVSAAFPSESTMQMRSRRLFLIHFPFASAITGVFGDSFKSLKGFHTGEVTMDFWTLRSEWRWAHY